MKPYTLPVQPEHIPDDLKNLPRWVLWRWHQNTQGKWTKPPCDARGRFCDPLDATKWQSFDDAMKLVAGFAGLGIVLGDGLAGVDLDDCLYGDRIAPRAEAIIDYIGSYAEKSPRGKGIKIFAYGNGTWNNLNPEIEIYGCGRYFTMTGHILKSGLVEATRRIQKLHDEFFPDASENKQSRHWKEKGAVDLADLPRSNRVRSLASLEHYELDYLQQFIERADRSHVGERSDRDFGLLCQAIRYHLDPAEVYTLVKHLSRYAERVQLFATDWTNAYNTSINPNERSIT